MKNAFGDWSNARYFLAVCREGSTLAASRKLGAAQPTVARRIEALEHELGLVLFERDTRGFRPTTAALRLLPAAEAMEAAAQVLQSTASELTAARPIRITAPVGNFSQRMRRIVYEFNLKHPGLEFEFLPTIKVLDLVVGERVLGIVKLTAHTVVTVTCLAMAYATFWLIADDIGQRTPAAGIPLVWTYVLPLMGFLLTAVRGVLFIVLLDVREVVAPRHKTT